MSSMPVVAQSAEPATRTSTDTRRGRDLTGMTDSIRSILSPRTWLLFFVAELDAKLTITPTSREINVRASPSRHGRDQLEPAVPVLRVSILRRHPERYLRSQSAGISFLPGSALGMKELFGERLRRLRNERGITVVDLAAAVGAAEGTIRQMENGSVKMPNFALGLRLADQLNVDPRYLALGEGFSMSERFDALERRLTKIEQRLESIPAARR